MIKWYSPEQKPHYICRWVLGILKPVNHKDFKDYTDWSNTFGLEKIWYNNSKFWHCGFHDKRSEELTDRLLCWAYIPDFIDTINEFKEKLNETV